MLGKAEANVARHAARATLPALQGTLGLATFLLARLHTGWNESGLWNPQALVSADAAEVEALEDELYFRLRGVQRATLPGIPDQSRSARGLAARPPGCAGGALRGHKPARSGIYPAEWNFNVRGIHDGADARGDDNQMLMQWALMTEPMRARTAGRRSSAVGV